MPLGVGGEQSACGFELRVVTDTSQRIQHLALRRRRITDAVRRKQGKIELPRELDRSLVARLFTAVKMPLQFHVNIFLPEDADQISQAIAAFVHRARWSGVCESTLQSRRKRAFIASG